MFFPKNPFHFAENHLYYIQRTAAEVISVAGKSLNIEY